MLHVIFETDRPTGKLGMILYTSQRKDLGHLDSFFYVSLEIVGASYTVIASLT